MLVCGTRDTLSGPGNPGLRMKQEDTMKSRVLILGITLLTVSAGANAQAVEPPAINTGHIPAKPAAATEHIDTRAGTAKTPNPGAQTRSVRSHTAPNEVTGIPQKMKSGVCRAMSTIKSQILAGPLQP